MVIVISTISVDYVYEISVSDIQYVSRIIGPGLGYVQTYDCPMLEISMQLVFPNGHLPVMRGGFPALIAVLATPVKWVPALCPIKWNALSGVP